MIDHGLQRLHWIKKNGRIEIPLSYKQIKFSSIHILVTALLVLAAKWKEYRTPVLHTNIQECWIKQKKYF